MADYKKNSLSLIVTVFNEEQSILALLESYKKQSLLADEMIVVDAGSKDETVNLIKKFSEDNPKLNIKLFIKKGNRSTGRNFAVSKAKVEWIAITDAGCILEKNWLKHLVQEAKSSQSQVVAGYYQGTAKTKIQEAFIPYFLVMPNQLKKVNFLPATRSMLIKKELWNSLGGSDESLDVEDYQMAKRIEAKGIKIAFAKEAIVYWEAPETWREFWQKTKSFSKGDVEGKVIRKKVYLIFLRYLLGFLSLLFSWQLAILLILFYSLWAITKNYQHCPNSWFLLPLVQIFSDLAVMSGVIKALR